SAARSLIPMARVEPALGMQVRPEMWFWLVRLGGDQPGDLVLDPEFSFLEAANRVVVGMGAGILFNDRMLEGCMLGLQRFDVVHGAHRQPPQLVGNILYVTPTRPRINLSPVNVHNSIGWSAWLTIRG